MSNKPRITRTRLNGWGLLALGLVVLFFWKYLLAIGGSLLGGWLLYRNRKEIYRFFQDHGGK